MILRSPYALIEEDDPYRDLLEDPEWLCPHGNGCRCGCQMPVYQGLFVWPLTGKDGKVRHIVSRMQQAHDGGMREFRNPDNPSETVGSCGVNFAKDRVKSLADFAAAHE